MTIQNVTLYTTDNKKIIGIKLPNGDVGCIKHTIETKTKNIICELPEGSMNMSNDTYQFVLDNGSLIKESLKVVLDHSLVRWMGI